MKPPLEIMDKVTDVVLGYRPRSMNELSHVVNQGNEVYVDSREVAKMFGIQHKSFVQLIEDHEDELSQLGVYRFENDKPSPGSEGGRPAKYYWLNFDQIAFLLTVSKTSAATKGLRLRLIIMFREARAKLRPVDGLLLSIPEVWRKTFKDEFYIALLRLYGDVFNPKINRPSWVGAWTNRFMYEPIFSELPQELKSKRAQYCTETGKDSEWIKLHQFLEQNAKEQLRDHISKITGFLQIAKNKQEFYEAFAALFGGGKQIRLDEFDDL